MKIMISGNNLPARVKKAGESVSMVCQGAIENGQSKFTWKGGCNMFKKSVLMILGLMTVFFASQSFAFFQMHCGAQDNGEPPQEECTREFHIQRDSEVEFRGYCWGYDKDTGEFFKHEDRISGYSDDGSPDFKMWITGDKDATQCNGYGNGFDYEAIKIKRPFFTSTGDDIIIHLQCPTDTFQDYIDAMGLSEAEIYLAGDWNGDGYGDIAIRRDNLILLNYDNDGAHDEEFTFGRASGEDEYLVGDWDGDDIDDIAIRRENQFLLNYDNDGGHDEEFVFGRASGEDEYLVGDWDGDGVDEIAIRRGNLFLLNYDNDGSHDEEFVFGRASGEDEYLVGDWDGDDIDDIAIRRENRFLLNYDNDGGHDEEFVFGRLSGEDEYLVGDWDNDGVDEIAIRRGNLFLLNYDNDGSHDEEFTFGIASE